MGAKRPTGGPDTGPFRGDERTLRRDHRTSWRADQSIGVAVRDPRLARQEGSHCNSIWVPRAYVPYAGSVGWAEQPGITVGALWREVNRHGVYWAVTVAVS